MQELCTVFDKKEQFDKRQVSKSRCLKTKYYEIFISHPPLGVCKALEKTYCHEGINKRSFFTFCYVSMD